MTRDPNTSDATGKGADATAPTGPGLLKAEAGSVTSPDFARRDEARLREVESALAAAKNRIAYLESEQANVAEALQKTISWRGVTCGPDEAIRALAKQRSAAEREREEVRYERDCARSDRALFVRDLAAAERRLREVERERDEAREALEACRDRRQKDNAASSSALGEARGALTRLVDATQAWCDAEDKPFSHEVWLERLAACDAWRFELAAARSLLVRDAPTPEGTRRETLISHSVPAPGGSVALGGADANGDGGKRDG